MMVKDLDKSVLCDSHLEIIDNNNNKSTKKKVLIVINTMGRAGAEKSLISLLKSFDYSRVSVSLLAIIARGELFLEVPDEVRILNKNPSAGPVLGTSGALYIAKTQLTRMLRQGHIFKSIPYAVNNIITQLKTGRFQIDKLLWLPLAETTAGLKNEYDMAIAFIEGAATYYVTKEVKAKNKVAFVHVNYEKAGYIKKLDYKYYQKMDYICCVSEAVKQGFIKVYPEYSGITRIFPNIIIPDDIRLAAQKKGGFSDGFEGLRILTVARLHAQKGLDEAILAFAKLVRQGYDNIKWYVLGAGTEKNRLLKLIKRHDLKNKFVLLGSDANPYPYIAQCDIYVQPSRFEGFSLTLQEALILNKPCLTTNFDGIPDMLHNGKDAIVIEFSKKNIAKSVKTLIDNKRLREMIADETKSIEFEFPNKTHILYEIMNGVHWDE